MVTGMSSAHMRGQWVRVALWGLSVVVVVQAQAQERRPLLHPRLEVTHPAVAEGEPGSSNTTFTLHTYESHQQDVEPGHTGGRDEGLEPSPRGRGHTRGPSRQSGSRRRQLPSGAPGQPRGTTRQGGSVSRPTGGGRRGHQRSHSALESGDSSPDTTHSTDTELSPRQMDTIVLMLQRLSDRLVSIETLQRQRAERIDTINYRLTKIELQAEERNGVMTELSNSLRHRMETTDNELDRLTTELDTIKTGISSLGQQHTELNTALTHTLHPEDGVQREQATVQKLQAVMAAIHGLRIVTQDIKEDIGHLDKNITVFSNITQNVEHLEEVMVTKQYLQQSLTEIKSAGSALPLMTQVMMQQSRPARRGQAKMGKMPRKAEDCWQLQRQGRNKSGVYSIQPRYSPTPFFVYCDMETDGGGWTVIQRREDGTVNFLREWADYKHGFGNLAGEFWLGNEKIHQLTNQYVSRLRVDLADFDQQTGHALYSAFAIGSELESYSLKMLGQYTGDAGDSLRYHVGQRFSTKDIDNDDWPDRSCARDHKGAWWYRACETSNLNGQYMHGPIPIDHQYTALYWYDFRGPQYSLWRSRMMIRRGGNVADPIFKDFSEIQNNTSTERPQEHQPTTSTPPPPEDNFNPDHDPYSTFEYPYY